MRVPVPAFACACACACAWTLSLYDHSNRSHPFLRHAATTVDPWDVLRIETLAQERGCCVGGCNVAAGAKGNAAAMSAAAVTAPLCNRQGRGVAQNRVGEGWRCCRSVRCVHPTCSPTPTLPLSVSRCLSFSLSRALSLSLALPPSLPLRYLARAYALTGSLPTAPRSFAGWGLRKWAQHTLGDLFTYQISNPGTLVTAPPYTVLLHPGYTGIVLHIAGVVMLSTVTWQRRRQVLTLESSISNRTPTSATVRRRACVSFDMRCTVLLVLFVGLQYINASFGCRVLSASVGPHGQAGAGVIQLLITMHTHSCTALRN